MCKPSEEARGVQLTTSHLPPVTSCLSYGAKSSLSGSLKRAILEVSSSLSFPLPLSFFMPLFHLFTPYLPFFLTFNVLHSDRGQWGSRNTN